MTDRCSMCPLYKAGRSHCIPTEVYHTGHPEQAYNGEPLDLLLVGHGPLAEDDIAGRPFMGLPGTLLRKALAQGEAWVGLTHGVRCRCFDKKIPLEAMEACREFLESDLQKYRPKIVVALGEQAYQAITGKKGSVKKLQDRPERLENGAWLLTSYHPINHIMGNDLNMAYASLFSKIVAILSTGTLTEPRPPDIREVTQDNLEDALYDLGLAGILSVDVETNTTDKEVSKSSVHLPGQRLLCIGVSTSLDRPTWVFPPRFFPQIRPYFGNGKVLLGHNCLTPDHQVLLEDGTSRTLGWMVAHKHPGPVMTVNEQTGLMEPRKVIGWIRNGPRQWEDWLQVRMRGKGVLSLTRDHEVLTERGRVKAEDLREGDRIWTQKVCLSEQQKALLIGTLLGDGSLLQNKKGPCTSRSPRFVCAHADVAYAMFKKRVLSRRGLEMHVRHVKNNRGFSRADGELYLLRSGADARLHDFYGCTKKEGVSTERLADVTEPSLAIWYCDDGSAESNGRVKICTSAFGKGGSRVLAEELTRRGYPFYVYERPDGHLYLTLPGRDSERWWKDIAPYVPECLRHKVPERYRGLNYSSFWEEETGSPGVWSDEVQFVGPLLKKEGAGRYEGRSRSSAGPKGPRQYCLQVEGNHNFFASGLSVSNCQYDCIALVWFLGWTEILEQPIEDTFLMHQSRDRGAIGNGLEDLAVKYLGVPPWKSRIRDLMDEERRRRLAEGDPSHPTMEDIPFQSLVQYNGRDCYYTLALYHEFQKLEIPRVYDWLRKPAVKLLTKLSVRGLPADRKYASSMAGMVRKHVAYLKRTLRRWTEVRWVEREREEPLNVRSTPHMQALVQATRVTVPLTKGGSPSTDKAVLQELSQEHPLWRRVSAARKYENILSKFLEPLAIHMTAEDGRIHATYHGARMVTSSEGGESFSGGARTNRLSCSNPNLQQISKEPLIRKIFIAPSGKFLVEIDFSGAEVRIMAWLSGCKQLIKWFKKGIDPYVELVRMVWGIPPEHCTKALRQEAKTAFLARMYGQGSINFAKRTKAPLERVEHFFTFFNHHFPEIIRFQRQLVKLVEAGKPVLTPWDNPRWFDARDYRFNALINDPIQCASSEILLHKAMGVEDGWDVEVINLIHDSVVLLVDEGKLHLIPEIRKYMVSPDSFPFQEPLTVPLDVEVKIGRNWGEMQVWKENQSCPIDNLSSVDYHKIA